MAVKDHGSENVCAVTVTYGQRHSKETDCARSIADHYEVPLHTIDLTDIFAGADCSLLSDN
jgi:7-cyano-7-deazaguanine synthase